MSKLNNKTKELIVSKALEMFNEKGIEYVGVREIAAALNMRVSNITYYFPKKDNLVYALSQELNRLNNKIVVSENEMTLESFLNMLMAVFQNHIKYRCLLLSFVHLMEQNKLISARYKKTTSNRNAVLYSNLSTLQHQGYIKFKNLNEVEFLVSTISIIIRFWISEAAVSLRHLKEKQQIQHYLNLIIGLLLPYMTVKGKRQLKKITANQNAKTLE